MKTFTRSAVAAILLLLSVASCKNGEAQKEPQIPIVNVAQAEAHLGTGQKEFAFISKPFRSSELSFRVGGPIGRFEVYAGNYYRRGETIAEIDPRDFRIRKQKTEAVYRQAKAEFERVKSLYEKNNLAASVYEKAEADYISARTAFETAANELADTRLIAPFDGYVGEVYIEKYQDVKATQPVISFIDINQLKIEAYVPQEIAFQSPRLERVALCFDSQKDTIYQAKVAEISRNTTPNNLSYLLTALLPNANGKLPAGMSGKVRIQPGETTADNGITVPQTALCHRPVTGNYVWVIDPGTQKVSQRPVTLGELLPDGKALVIKGVKAGETLATSGLRFLSEGVKVKPHTGINR